MKKLILTFSILFFSISTVNAGNVIGYLDCGKFLSGCDESKSQIDCWVQTYFAAGYISGLSVTQNVNWNSGTLNADNIKYSLIKYCRENPLKDTHLGAQYIFDQLQ